METAGWTSSLFQNADNPWGMKQAKVRPNHQDGAYTSGGAKFANYADAYNAVLDLQDWVEYTGFPEYPLSLQEHIKEMKKRGYFGEPEGDYLALVLAWQKR